MSADFWQEISIRPSHLFTLHTFYKIVGLIIHFNYRKIPQYTKAWSRFWSCFQLIYKWIVYVLPMSSGDRSAEATDNCHLNNTNLADKIYAHVRWVCNGYLGNSNLKTARNHKRVPSCPWITWHHDNKLVHNTHQLLWISGKKSKRLHVPANWLPSS